MPHEHKPGAKVTINGVPLGDLASIKPVPPDQQFGTYSQNESGLYVPGAPFDGGVSFTASAEPAPSIVKQIEESVAKMVEARRRDRAMRYIMDPLAWASRLPAEVPWAEVFG